MLPTKIQALQAHSMKNHNNMSHTQTKHVFSKQMERLSSRVVNLAHQPGNFALGDYTDGVCVFLFAPCLPLVQNVTLHRCIFLGYSGFLLVIITALFREILHVNAGFVYNLGKSSPMIFHNLTLWIVASFSNTPCSLTELKATLKWNAKSN